LAGLGLGAGAAVLAGVGALTAEEGAELAEVGEGLVSGGGAAEAAVSAGIVAAAGGGIGLATGLNVRDGGLGAADAAAFVGSAVF